MATDSGTYTDDTIQRRRKIAEAMLGDPKTPVKHWAEGLSEIGKGLLGGYQYSKADELERSKEAESNAAIYAMAGLPAPARANSESQGGFQKLAALMSGSGEAAPVAPAAPAITPPMASPAAVSPIPPQPQAAPSGPGKIYSNDEPSPLDPPSGTDRKAMIATILGEAGNQGPQGMNAVGSVIRNRAVNGGFGGDTPTGVVTAKNQFEPWNTSQGQAKMAAAMTDPKQVAAADQAIAMAYGEGGAAPADPTNGAMNFVAPKAQAALGREMPKWAQGPGQDIGDHRFFGGKPQDPSQAPYQVAGPSTAAPGTQVAQAMGAPPAQPPTAPSGIFAGVPQDKIPGILQGLTSKNPTMKALAVQQLGNFNKPNEFGFQTQPDGTILRTDPRKGTVEPVYQGATKPTFGKVGTDPTTGEDMMGFIDSAGRKIEPYRPQSASGQSSSLPPTPPGVDPKVWRKEFSENAAKGATPGSFDDTTKLRHEFTQLPAYKNMAQAVPVYQSMRDAAGRDTKAADLNIVYGLGKIMDPGSVVREGELVLANNAQGWQEKLNGMIAQINSKGALTPEGREALMAEAHSRISSYKNEFDRDAGRYKGITERNRINTADVIPDFGSLEPWSAPKKSAIPIEIDGYKIKAR